MKEPVRELVRDCTVVLRIILVCILLVRDCTVVLRIILVCILTSAEFPDVCVLTLV